MSEQFWIAVVAGLAMVLAGGWTAIRSRRSPAKEEEIAQAAIFSERFQDADNLARYIREQIEAAVAPVRTELATVKAESHEMHDAIRSFFTQLWVWDRKGRPGELPTFPEKILHKLGLGHFIDYPLDDTVDHFEKENNS